MGSLGKDIRLRAGRAGRIFALFVLVSLGWVSFARAGGSGENAVLIIDPQNQESLYVGNYYRTARNIPAEHVIYMRPEAEDFDGFLEFQREGFLGTLATRGIEGAIDYVVIPPGGGYRMEAQGLISDPCATVRRFSTTAAYAMSRALEDVQPGTTVWTRNQYYPGNDSARAFSSNTSWLGGAPSNAPGARHYFIAAMLGYSGPRGNTIDETIAMIDRSVGADGANPEGTFYFMRTTDRVRSAPRHFTFPAAISTLDALGFVGEQLEAVLPVGRHDCLGVMTGWAGPNIVGADMTLLPGAFCDHLTSYAAYFDTSSQTKVSAWIAKGASGSWGAVEEPCNYAGKFPHARAHVYYAQGLSLGEAVFRSVEYAPYQMLLYGDPLTRPFATAPSVEVIDAPMGTVSGELSLTPVVATDLEGAAIERVELMIDGRIRAVAAPGEALVFDTWHLPDGWHEVRVLATDDTLVANVGRWAGSVTTDNAGRWVTLNCDLDSGDLDSVMMVDVEAGGGEVAEIRVLQNRRVLAVTAGSSGSFSIHARQVGAGPVTLSAEARFNDGRQAVSMPFTVDIDYSPRTKAGDRDGNAAPVAYGFVTDVSVDVSTLVEMPAGDVDGDALGFELIDAPLKSDVIQEGSVLLLTPHAGASGVDSLRFRASDGALESAAATVTIRYVGATGASSDVTITASPAPIVCGGETITLDGGEGISWVWSTGATTRTIEVSRSGAYGVTVEVAPGRQVFGSIEVWVGEPGLLLEVALQGLTRSVERSLSVTVGDCEGMVAARDVAAAFSESGEAELAMVDFGFEPTWVSVTEGHALRGVAAADVDGCGIARVSLTGGNALLSGDLQTAMMPKDDFVDVADFAILAVHWGMGVDPESAYGADINGDGIQGAADFTAILVNYFESGDGAYCGVKAAGEGSSWIAADTLSSAMRRAADRDGNGRVDGRDMLLFADELRIDIAPSLRMKLERMARTTRD